MNDKIFELDFEEINFGLAGMFDFGFHEMENQNANSKIVNEHTIKWCKNNIY